MELTIKFPGNKKVTAQWNGLTVSTDQPQEAGGDGTAPAPFDLFLASIGTCAGLFVLSFCRKRGIPTEGLELVERVDWNEATHHADAIELEIVLPDGFPERYRGSVIAAANLCTVKKHIAAPPRFSIRTRERAGRPS